MKIIVEMETYTFTILSSMLEYISDIDGMMRNQTRTHRLLCVAMRSYAHVFSHLSASQRPNKETPHKFFTIERKELDCNICWFL